MALTDIDAHQDGVARLERDEGAGQAGEAERVEAPRDRGQARGESQRAGERRKRLVRAPSHRVPGVPRRRAVV
jgi:hypothetical protein